MAPDRGDGAQLGVLHAVDLATVVLDGKIEVGLARHHDRLGLDPAQGLGEIAAVEFVGADIGVLPHPQHRQEVVGVAAAETRLPAADEKILQRRKPKPAPHLLAVEGLAEPPPGIDPAERLKPAHRLGGEPVILPGRIGAERGPHPFEKDEIMRRGLGRAADRGDPLDPVREQRAPMKRLLRAHREAIDQADPLDAEHFLHQALLDAHIVGHGEMRVAAAVEGWRRATMWQAFRQYHYLNSKIASACRCYVAVYQGKPVAFIAVMHIKMLVNYYRVSRLVVLPDYQGIGVGKKLLNFVAELYTSQVNLPFYLVTSNPQLVRGNLGNWRVKRVGHGSCGRRRYSNQSRINTD